MIGSLLWNHWFWITLFTGNAQYLGEIISTVSKRNCIIKNNFVYIKVGFKKIFHLFLTLASRCYCDSLLIQPYDVPAPSLQVKKQTVHNAKYFAIFNFRVLVLMTW